MSSLDDVMWLCNVRGGDAPCNPVTLSYVLVGETEASLYVDVDKATDAVRAHLAEANVTIKPYEDMSKDVYASAHAGETLWMDVDRGVHRHARGGGGGRRRRAAPRQIGAFGASGDVSSSASASPVKEGTCPIAIAKAVKNDAEMAGMVEAHLRDGAAMAEFWCWMEKEIASGRTVDEYEAGERVMACRKKQGDFIEESFPTIAGEGPHGAVVHCRRHAESARVIGGESLLLCDSGGQYACGTTDVTRTAHFGTPTDHQKECYTRVLQGTHRARLRRVPLGHQRFRPRRLRALAPVGGGTGLPSRHRTRRGGGAQRARGAAEHLAAIREPHPAPPGNGAQQRAGILRGRRVRHSHREPAHRARTPSTTLATRVS